MKKTIGTKKPKKARKKFNLSEAFETKRFRITFSIVIAVLLWTYVAYAENPDITGTINNIPVEFVGQEALAEANLVLEDMGDINSKVTIEFKGKRNMVTKLSSSNTSLTVDLAEIIRTGGGAGVYQLQYDINFPDDVNESNLTVEEASVDFITVTVKKLVTKSVVVKGINDCSTADGYQSEPMEFEPETITVSGPEDAVNAVDAAQVTLVRFNVAKTIQEEVEVVLVDKNGQPLPEKILNNLTLSQSTVLVTLPVVMVKEVTLNVNFVYGNSATEANVSYEIFPSVITISGDAEILKDINSINLGTIDLKSFGTSTSETFPITVPNDVDNLSGATTATVDVEILNQSTARISANNIQYRNNTEGMNVEIITQSLDILLRGSEESLDKITSDNIRIVADLAELGTATGTMSVTAVVYVDGYTDVDAIGEYKISVSIAEGRS